MAQTVSAQMCVSSNPEDLDGDFIPNSWEMNGVDINSDGTVDLDLKARGFSPTHKDLGLEADYMKHHRPNGIRLNIVSAFENAISESVCNPDGIKGIRLHFEIGDEIPHQDSITVYEPIIGYWKETWKGFDDIKDRYFGNLTERSSNNSANILDAKRQIYHYVIFAHTFNHQNNSGISRGIPGMDFIVSLGHDGWPTDRYGHSVGTPSLQEGTLMHELGHNLGLNHGGGDYVNYKPNYFSVMNYQLQMPYKVDNRPLGFSECAVLPINETNLIEKNGIGQSCPPERLMFISCPQHIKSIQVAGEGFDLTGDGDADDVGLAADLNCDGETAILNSYDDWANLKFLTSPAKRWSDTEGSSMETSTILSGQTPLNLTKFYNETLLGEQFNELTPEDMNQQLAEKTDLVNMEINKTQRDIVPRASGLTELAEISPEGAQGGFEPEEANVSLVKETYAQVLGTQNVSTVTNGTSQNNTTKGLILSGNIDEAIENIEVIASTMDSAKGGIPNNDLITNPSDQLRIGRVLESTLNSLKSLTCTYSDC